MKSANGFANQTVIKQGKIWAPLMISLLLGILFGILIDSESVQAAQDATIRSDQTKIFKKPDASSSLLEQANSGEKVRVSNAHKNGWYKIKTKSGGYGWISQNDLVLSAATSEKLPEKIEHKPEQHERDHAEKNFSARAIAHGFVILSPQLSKLLSQSNGHPYFAIMGTGELGYQLGGNYRLALRGGYYQSKSSVAALNGTTYQIEHAGYPVLFGLDRNLAEPGNWEISAAIYGGITYNHSLLVRADGFDAPNTFVIEEIGYTGALIFAGKYPLWEGWKLIAEVGGYFSYHPKTSIQGDFNGGEPFRTSEGMNKVSLENFGPLFGVGLQASF